MFWMWCHRGIALWHHSSDVWHNALFLATASNVNGWADVANHVAWLWQRVIQKILNAVSQATNGPYHSLELPNHRINFALNFKLRGFYCKYFVHNQPCYNGTIWHRWVQKFQHDVNHINQGFNLSCNTHNQTGHHSWMDAINSSVKVQLSCTNLPRDSVKTVHRL